MVGHVLGKRNHLNHERGLNMFIIIKSTNVRKVTTANGAALIKQQAAIDIGADFPLAFELTVDTPYPPGRYNLSPRSFRVNQYGSLELSPFNQELIEAK